MNTPAKPKKSFKLNMFGIFKLEIEEWGFKEVILILFIIMLFVIILFFLLKAYVLPAIGGPVILNKCWIWLGKVLKSRSP